MQVSFYTSLPPEIKQMIFTLVCDGSSKTARKLAAVCQEWAALTFEDAAWMSRLETFREAKLRHGMELGYQFHPPII